MVTGEKFKANLNCPQKIKIRSYPTVATSSGPKIKWAYVGSEAILGNIVSIQ